MHVVGKLLVLSDLTQSLYDYQYDELFGVLSISAPYLPVLRYTVYSLNLLARPEHTPSHTCYYLCEVQILAYAQLFKSFYSSLILESMGFVISVSM
jgi:hypothetical protein